MISPIVGESGIGDVCVECGKGIVFIEGCKVCQYCGWSTC